MSEAAEDLVDDAVQSANDIVPDSRVTAAPARKQLSKDKERALAEDSVDKVKAGAEERDEEQTDDSQLSLQPSAELSSSASLIFASLSLRFEDTKAEADQTILLHGDALLLHCVDDPLLCWSPPWTAADGHRRGEEAELRPLGCGGQFLHLAFAFELELQRLCEGGRQCRLLWLDDFAASIACRPDLLSARELLRLHAGRHCRLQQDSFASVTTPAFAAFLERVDPAFIIVGDGHDAAYASLPAVAASPLRVRVRPDARPDALPAQPRLPLRQAE